MTRTQVETQRPADGLLKLCEGPALIPTRVVRDITINGNAWQTAYDKCAARMRCLVWWVDAAAKEDPPAECRSAP